MANGDSGTFVAGGPEDRGFFGHPKGLSVLFFSELWERFSFYGMRALLVLYMVKELDYSKDEKAYPIYGAYGALVYAFPILGGWLANKWLGYRRSIILGGSLMALGHFTMAIPALEELGIGGKSAEWAFEYSFYVALALLCLGNGFFKPNISSTVGRLYGENDPRRDRGFTIFYMGINIGALLAPLVCGYFGERINWHLGFSLAGVGMVIGLVWFVYGHKWIGSHGEPEDPDLLHRPVVGGLNRLHLTILGAFLAVPLVALSLQEFESAHWIIQGVSAAVVVILIGFTVRLEGPAKLRMVALMILMVFHMLFWAGFEQAGSSLNVLTDEHVHRTFFGKPIAASQLQAVNPLMIVLLAPFFSFLWKITQQRGWEPSVPMKFALGLFQLGLGFLVIVFGIERANDQATVALGWLVLMYLLHTTGELCLSPVGLSAVTKLAPQRWVGFCMGAWFLTIANAHLLAAGIAQLTAARHGPAPIEAPEVEVSSETRAEILEKLSPSSATQLSVLAEAYQVPREVILSWPKTREKIASVLAPPEEGTNAGGGAVPPTIGGIAARYGISSDEILAWDATRREILRQVALEEPADIANGAAQASVAERVGVEPKRIEDWRKESIEQYAEIFWSVFWIAMIAGGVLVILTPFVKKLMQGVE